MRILPSITICLNTNDRSIINVVFCLRSTLSTGDKALPHTNNTKGFMRILPSIAQSHQSPSQPFLCLQEPCVATINQLHRKLSIALFMKCRLQCCTGQFIKNIAFTRIHIHHQRHYIKVRTIERHKLFSGLYKRPLLHLRIDIYGQGTPLYGPYLKFTVHKKDISHSQPE